MSDLKYLHYEIDARSKAKSPLLNVDKLKINPVSIIISTRTDIAKLCTDDDFSV